VSVRRKIAGALYQNVSSGRIAFRDALRLFKPAAFLQMRKAPPSSRFRHLSTLDYIVQATKKDDRSAWISAFFPAELLRLFDIDPLALELMGSLFAQVGLSRAFLDIADADDVPATMCSFHRYIMGLSKTAFLHRPRLVAASSLLCDGNIKSFAEAAREQGVPFFFLDVPCSDGEEAVRYVRAQLAELMERFSELTGIKPDAERIGRVVRNANSAIERMARFNVQRSAKDLNLQRGYEMANFIFPFQLMMGSDELPKILDAMIDDYEAGRRNRYFEADAIDASCKRIMWLHIVPQYPTPIWDVIDDGKRARVVCDEYSTQPFAAYDAQDFVGSMARRLLGHPSNGPLARRIEHILSVARAFRIDGIVHYSSWGCRQAAGNVQLLEDAIERAGFKFLCIDGDAVDERNASSQQHKTRLEAFLESMEHHSVRGIANSASKKVRYR
jgi:benzoyl-CoA reductase/2-hydroxyglutaryl-CoA dehydratase subunit BcrC/BadD/HgdB